MVSGMLPPRTHILFSVVTLLQFLSLGQTFLFSQLPLLNNMLPGPSASKVMTLWRYTNLFIIIIITTCKYARTKRQTS